MAVTSTHVVVSTAMLTALWSKRRSDVLDLLIPFVKDKIGSDSGVGEKVDEHDVRQFLMEDLGYADLPIGVARLLLKRLVSQGVLLHRDGEYILAKSLEADVAAFDAQRRAVQQRQENVGERLAMHLNEHLAEGRNGHDVSTALESLVSFFSRYGLTVAKDDRYLNTVKRRDGALDYQIAQFVLEERRQESPIYDGILDLLQGYFVSTVVYFQPNNLNVASASFRDTYVYMDTRIMLSLLDLQSHEERTSTQQVVELLQEKGAKVACFRHIVEEVGNIVRAYKHSIESREHGAVEFRHTLSGLDRRRVTPGQIDVLLAALDARIRALGIEIAEPPDNVLLGSYPIDSLGLEAAIKREMRPYRSDVARERDIRSVAYIRALRGNSRAQEIERCRHILATTNVDLIRVSNDFTKDVFGDSLGPLVSIDDLSAVMWLKCGKVNDDFPANKLLAIAQLSLEPDAEILGKASAIAEDILKRGGATLEEVQAIRAGIFDKRKLMESIDGDSKNVSEPVVEQVIEGLRKDYGERDERLVSELREKATRTEKQREATIRAAFEAIDEAGEIAKKVVTFVLRAIGVVLLVVLFAFSAWTAFDSYRTSSASGVACGLAVLVVALIGAYDATLGKRRVMGGVINRLADLVADFFKDRKRDEYRRVLGDDFEC